MMLRSITTSVLLAVASLAYAQDDAHQLDVESVDAIIDAYYDVISGPAGHEYDAERDAALHAPLAIITRLSAAGLDNRHDLAAEQDTVPPVYEEAFFEVEVNRIVEHYGNMAHVWSTYEVRPSPEGNASSLGLNSISLYRDEGRWWIASWSTQLVDDDNPLPDRYLGR